MGYTLQDGCTECNPYLQKYSTEKVLDREVPVWYTRDMDTTNQLPPPEHHYMSTLSVEGDQIMWVAANMLAEELWHNGAAAFAEALDEWKLQDRAEEIYRSIRPEGAAPDACYTDTEVRYEIWAVVMERLHQIRRVTA